MRNGCPSAVLQVPRAHFLGILRTTRPDQTSNYGKESRIHKPTKLRFPLASLPTNLKNEYGPYPKMSTQKKKRRHSGFHQVSTWPLSSPTKRPRSQPGGRFSTNRNPFTLARDAHDRTGKQKNPQTEKKNERKGSPGSVHPFLGKSYFAGCSVCFPAALRFLLGWRWLGSKSLNFSSSGGDFNH